MKEDTRLIHSKGAVDPHTGALSVPIYQVSTFHQEDMENSRYQYSRSGNPTREVLEDTIAELERGCGGFAYASGMAAISSVLLMFSPGDHLIAPRDIYGGTHRLLTSILSRFRIETTLVDMTDLDQVRQAVKSSTRAIWLETPSNPLLKITDIPGVVEIAQDRRLLTIIDNTFMTPYYQRPLDLGVDIVVHSATKFLAGHSDVIAGLAVARNEQLAKKIGFLQNALGSILGPQDSWLVLRGIRTLGVRMERQQQAAQKVAEWLAGSAAVEAVYYPGLPDHPGKAVHDRQSSGAGAVLSFRLPDEAAARRLMDRVRLMAVAVSLGGVESILSYPKVMSHGAVPEEERLAMGISGGLVRLSVGLEDADDLIQDLEQALKG
ncbi:MAG: methionine biosynthesis PLP-dependent protein [Firmicutes bacterium]|nr:methionine biosynthesis PLP-dependent protein [Bacillota bacterium]